MARFRIQDFNSIEKVPTSPAALRNKVTEMLFNSMVARVKVEAVNPDTGEYRVVLQGTLDADASKWDDK